MEEFEDMDAELFQQAVHEHAIFLGIDPENEKQYLWIAEKALLAPLPENWKQGKDENGVPYHFNTVTKESIWEHPKDQEFKELYERLKNEAIRAGVYGNDNGGNPELEGNNRAAAESLQEFDEIEEFDYNEESLEQHDLRDQPSPPQIQTTKRGNDQTEVQSLDGDDDEWMNEIVEEVEKHDNSSAANPESESYHEETPHASPTWNNPSSNQRQFEHSPRYADAVEQFDEPTTLEDEAVEVRNTSSQGWGVQRSESNSNQSNPNDEQTILRLRRQLDARQSQIQDSDFEISKLQKQLSVMSSESQATQQKLKTYKATIEELETKLDEAKKYGPKVADLEAQVEALKRKNVEMSSLEHDFTDARAKFQQSTKEVIDLSQKFATSESEKHKLTLEVQTLEQKIATYDEKLSNVQEQLDAANKHSKQQEQNIIAMEEKIKELQEENSDLNQKYEARKAAGPLAPDERLQLESHKTNLAKAEALSKAYQERLQLALEEKEELLKQIQKQRIDFKERISSLENSNRRLDSDLGVLSREQNERVLAAEAERADAVRCLREAEAKVLKSESEQRRDQLRATRAETKLDEATETIKDLREHLSKLTTNDTDHTETLRQDSQRVNSQLLESQRTIRNLQEKIRNLETAHALEISSLNDKYSSEISEAMEEATRRAGLEWQKRGSAKLKVISDKLANVTDTAAKEKRVLQAEIGSLRAQLERYGDGNEKMAQDMSAEIIKLNATNKTLVTLLNDARSQLRNQTPSVPNQSTQVLVHEASAGNNSSKNRNSISLEQLQQQIEDLRSKCFQVIHSEASVTTGVENNSDVNHSGRGKLTADDMSEESKEHMITTHKTLDAEQLDLSMADSWSKRDQDSSISKWLEKSMNNTFVETAGSLRQHGIFGGLNTPSKSFLRSASRLDYSLQETAIDPKMQSEINTRRNTQFSLDELEPDDRSHAVAALTASYGGSHTDSAWYRRDYWRNRYASS